jgi:hypothetical protein
MIVAYILSISLIIMSVIKVTDTFIELDQNFMKVQSEFIKETRKQLKNEKGSITLLSAMLTLVVSALLLFYSQKNAVELKEAKYRKESYLCMAYLNQQTIQYIKDINKFNWSLRALFISYSTGINIAQIKIAIEIAKLARNARHLYYIKNIQLNKYCTHPTMSLSYLKNQPYKTIGILKLQTNPDETTILGQSQWNTIIYKSPEGIRLKKAFCLKSTFALTNSFSSNLRISNQEITLKDSLMLKCLSGSPSS